LPLIAMHRVWWKLSKKITYLFSKFNCLRPKKFVCHPTIGFFRWQLKPIFDHHPTIDCWMTIKFFCLLVTKFGKGACNMFLESSHQALHTTTTCDWKSSGQLLKTIIVGNWKVVLVAKLLVIEKKVSIIQPLVIENFWSVA
jgi:hypothetical protein